MKIIKLFILFLILIGISIIGWLFTRYHTTSPMYISVLEFTNQQYPDNTASLSLHYGDYSHKKVKLDRKDKTHFDFTFLPTNSRSATIIFKNVDVSLMTPNLPNWVKSSKNNTRIALTDRQWNRQQCFFDPHSEYIEVNGGDGYEKEKLYSAELAKNCLNAGLWELQLYTYENGEKRLYYQGWFTFPLGYYKQLFEDNTGLSYWKPWYYLEHWVDPSGTKIDLESLRQVVSQRKVPAYFNANEPIQMDGEQKRKSKNILAKKIYVWGDFISGQSISFATFIPPGIYNLNKPWHSEFWRLMYFNGAILRQIITPADSHKILQELVLLFSDNQGKKSYFIISGFNLNELPHLSETDYVNGFFRVMGIGVPPVFQTYPDLLKYHPDKSPFFSVYLDEQQRWINHHKVGIDGELLFLDKNNPNKLHVYLVSYERDTLIAHYIITVGSSS